MKPSSSYPYDEQSKGQVCCQDKKIFFGTISPLLILFLLPFSGVCLNGPRNLQEIKNYLEQAPAIEYAVIVTTNDGRGVSLPSSVPGAKKAHVLSRHQGARQEGNFYARALVADADEDALLGTNSPTLSGKAGRTVWYATAAYAVKFDLSEEEATDFPRYEGTNDVARYAANYARMFFRFLDLGLIDIKRGTYQFEGKKFTVQLNRGRSADGELLDEDGTVRAIRFRIVGDAKSVISEFAYSTNDAIPSFLPSRVVQKVYDQDGTLHGISQNFEFVEVRLGQGSKELSYFLPDRFYNKASNSNRIRGTVEMISTNGNTYQRIGTNLALATPIATPRSRFSPLAVLITILVLTIGTAVMIWRTRNKPQKP